VGSAAGNPRFSTFSQGIGDIRITAYKWLVAPEASKKLNYPRAIIKQRIFFIIN